MPTYKYPKDTSRIERKFLIEDQPKVGDISQYTFPEGTSTNQVRYENSRSLPINNDKFQNKDLNVTCVGDMQNEKIIERNLQSEAVSGIRVDKMYVAYTGYKQSLKDVHVKMWMFSQKWLDEKGGGIDESTGNDTPGSLADATGVDTALGVQSTQDRVFYYPVGNLGSGQDLGNLTFIEGIDIISNISGSSIDDVVIGDHGYLGSNDGSGAPDPYNPEIMLTKNETEGQTSVFDENTENQIYIITECAGNGTDPSDDRQNRIQIFKLNNLEFFTENGNPKSTTFSFSDMYAGEVFVRDGGGGITSPALEVTDFQVTVNTRDLNNNWDGTPAYFSGDEKEYRDFFEHVKPIVTFNPSFHLSKVDKHTFLNISPKNQLDNFLGAGDTNDRTDDFPDYFPKQHIGILNIQTNDLEPQIYLDEYRDDLDERLQSIGSAPAEISFDLEMVYSRFSDGTFRTDMKNDMIPYASKNNDTNLAKSFYYFVINWDDNNDEIKTLDDWLEIRPTTYKELRELQNNNLYKVVKQTQSQTNTPAEKTIEFSQRLSNTYTSPGIKTIKTIIFSYNDDSNEVGRWKLLTSRFYLDIPINQYQDFGDVGGGNYTTIPWPFTTPIVGGVSTESKYKTSVRETLSGGKIGNADVIDEKLLIEDLQNDEMGKSILTFDLEQIRYFNRPYGINNLLGLVYSDELVGENVYLTSEEHLQTLPGFFGLGMTIDELSWSPGIGYLNPAFGENGYLLTRFTYDELKSLWELQQDRINAGMGSNIFDAMNQYLNYTLDNNNWIYNEEDFDNFIYDGFITAETGVFVNNMAIAIYRLQVGLFPEIPDYALNSGDISRWQDVGRPDIAQYVQSVIAGEAQPNPPIIDEGGNQTFGGGPNEGGSEGGIIEGGLEGTEPHFQGGVPLPGGGGVSEDDDDDSGNQFPGLFPKIELVNPPTGDFVSNTLITVEWKQINDRILNLFNPGEYGAPYTNNAYYFSQGKEPSSWNSVQIELESKNTYNTGLPDIFLGSLTIEQAEDLNQGLQGSHQKATFTIPSAEQMGLSIDVDETITENYRLKLTVSNGVQTIEERQPSNIAIGFQMVGGAAPPIGTRPKKDFENPTFVTLETSLPHRYNKTLSDGSPFWDGVYNKFSQETSVGQIFITDNVDLDLKQSCKLEINTGELSGKSIYDSSGNSNKGMLIGDYKVAKTRKGTPMRRDSFIKFAGKVNNRDGAL